MATLNFILMLFFQYSEISNSFMHGIPSFLISFNTYDISFKVIKERINEITLETKY